MKTLFNHKYRVIGWLTLGASVLLSIWGVWADDVINNDGVEYVRAAELMKSGDWQAALNVFKWPLYPLGIAAISAVTGLSSETAAHVFDASLVALLCVAFVATVIELGANFRTVIAAAAIVILAKSINDYRPFVIRDPGYLAFYMLGVLYLFRFHNRGRWVDAGKALLFGIVATLFRIEGAAFVVLIPMMALGRTITGYRGRILTVCLGLIATTVLIAGFVMWFLSLGGGRVDGGSASDVVAGSWEQIVASVADKLHVIEVELLGTHSADYAWSVMLGTLFLIIFVETLKNVSIWSGFLVVWSLFKKLTFPNRRCLEPWIWLIVINIGVLVAFTLVNLFLTGRYTLALTLTLLLAAPFGLLDLYERWRRPVSEGGWFIKFAYPLMVLLIFVSGIEGLGLGTEKGHIKTAGQWIGEQTSDEASLFTNTKILAHYSGKPFENCEIVSNWRQVVDAVSGEKFARFDMAAIRIGKKYGYRADRLIELAGQEPARVFENDDGDRIFVFRNR